MSHSIGPFEIERLGAHATSNDTLLDSERREALRKLSVWTPPVMLSLLLAQREAAALSQSVPKEPFYASLIDPDAFVSQADLGQDEPTDEL